MFPTNFFSRPRLFVAGGALAAALVSACSSDQPTTDERATVAAIASAHPSAATIVQLFDWRFSDIELEMPRLAAIGYSHVHVSPPTLSNPSNQWWARYQPVDYRVIDGPLGTDADFRKMIEKARTHNIRIVVDVVLNHMANLGRDYDLTYPSPKTQSEYSLSGPLFTASNFHTPFCIRNYADSGEAKNGRICGGGDDSGLPDLRQDDPEVFNKQREYLLRMRGLGVGGFRIDAMKHMEESYFGGLLAGEVSSDDALVFGEIIDPDGGEIAKYMQVTSSTTKFYDFPLLATMQKALRFGGDLRSLRDGRSLYGPRAVTFVVNHDIPQNPMEHFYMGTCTRDYGDPVNEKLAYAVVLGRLDGMPYVYSDRGTKGNDGVRSDAYEDAHCDEDIVRMVKFRATTLTLEQAWLNYESADQILWRRGKKAFVALNKSDSSWSPALPVENTSLEAGTYRDLLSDGTVSVKDGRILGLRVGARRAGMFVHESEAPATPSAGACSRKRPPHCP